MGSRAFIFRVLGPLIFFVIYVYVAHQLTRFAQFKFFEAAAICIIVFIPFSAFLSLPLFFWGKNHGTIEKKWEQRFLAFAHFCLSYLSYLICLILFRDLFATIDILFNWGFITYSKEESILILTLPVILKVAGRFVILTGPYIVKKKIKFKKIPDSLIGKKIAQISDLHISPSVGPDYVKKVVKKTNDLYPDFVVLTGDIFDGPVARHRKAIHELKNLKAKEAIFYIAGNHEYYWTADQFFKVIREIGFKALENENKKIGEIVFAGVTDPAAKWFDKEAPNIEKALHGTKEDDFVVMLAHQPNIADIISKTHVRLQLSGHTHAGQFLPWSLVIGLFQKYARGLYKIGKLQLYVNIGTGYWGPADRLGTFCEVTEIILDRG